MKSRINFSDLKIGDLVLTSNNKIGEIIALKSYAYLNNKINKKSQIDSQNNNEKKTFKLDNSRHNGVWYATVTVAIEDEKSKVPQYYIENLDFIEIKKIINNESKTQSFFNKIIKTIKTYKFLS